MAHPVTSLLLLALTVSLAVLAVAEIRREPRRLGNAALIAVTVLALLLTLTSLGSAILGGMLVLGGLALLPAIAVLVGFLLWNGVVMLRRERRSVGNLLSLAAGAGVAVAATVAAWCTLVVPTLFPLALWLFLACAWASFVLLAYLGYSWLYQVIVRRRRPRYVITLGAGLVDGRVSPLLAGRVDRAIELARAAGSAEHRPLLVLSGGQGPDEPRSEAAAMAEHAIARGVDGRDLVCEHESRSTAQNLRLSLRALHADGRVPPTARGLAVTSDYHALRAAILARRLGVPVDVAGARTARYYFPSAALREVIAIVRDAWP